MLNILLNLTFPLEGITTSFTKVLSRIIIDFVIFIEGICNNDVTSSFTIFLSSYRYTFFKYVICEKKKDIKLLVVLAKHIAIAFSQIYFWPY